MAVNKPVNDRGNACAPTIEANAWPGAREANVEQFLSLATAVPCVLSPLVGWLVDVASFEVVFVADALVIGSAGLLTFRVREPRLLQKLDADSDDWPE
ncbi:MAG: hypothetical protein MI757_02970 [Pirellulales bacterium]|nr:hypothetical protein [Pirellulales bacterium]